LKKTTSLLKGKFSFFSKTGEGFTLFFLQVSHPLSCKKKSRQAEKTQHVEIERLCLFP